MKVMLPFLILRVRKEVTPCWKKLGSPLRYHRGASCGTDPTGSTATSTDPTGPAPRHLDKII